MEGNQSLVPSVFFSHSWFFILFLFLFVSFLKPSISLNLGLSNLVLLLAIESQGPSVSISPVPGLQGPASYFYMGSGDWTEAIGLSVRQALY